MMPLICLYTVPPAAMRYADVGDWHYSHKGLEIRVPRGLSDEETLLVMVHELVESFLVRRDGVHEAAVNAFDHDHRGRVRRTLKARIGRCLNSPSRVACLLHVRHAKAAQLLDVLLH
jgi:hypothetical protein